MVAAQSAKPSILKEAKWYDAVRRLVAAHGLILFGVLGLCARVVIAIYTLGSNDMVTWQSFAQQIAAKGLGNQYDTVKVFNHPPLMGLMASSLYSFAEWAGARFDVLFKIPVIMADAVSATLIHRSWNDRGARYAGLAFALFCWNPISLAVTSYHGNTDSLCAALALLAAVLVDRRYIFLGGLALAGAINVKLIPVMLIPVLLSCLGSRRALVRFMLGLSIGVIPFAPVALFHWDGFRAHVLGWRSFTGEWGITGLLKEIGANTHFKKFCADALKFLTDRGALFVLGIPALLAAINAWLARRWSARELAACAFASFVVFAPGWGIQYIVYPIPLMFAANLNRAVVFSAIGGAYTTLVYVGLWTGTHPAYSNFYSGQPLGGKIVGYLAWMACAQALIELLRARTRPPSLAAPS